METSNVVANGNLLAAHLFLRIHPVTLKTEHSIYTHYFAGYISCSDAKPHTSLSSGPPKSTQEA